MQTLSLHLPLCIGNSPVGNGGAPVGRIPQTQEDADETMSESLSAS